MAQKQSTKIEIFDRKSGEVIETKEVPNLGNFSFYWDHQCDNSRYGWRIAVAPDPYANSSRFGE